MTKNRAAWAGLWALSASLMLAVAVPAENDAESWAGTPQEEFLRGPIVRKFQCVTCHTVADEGGTVGPILNLVGLRRDADWLERWLHDPNAVKPGTKMPKFPFTEEERRQTVEALARMTRQLQTEQIIASTAPSVDRGRALFLDYDCYA